jgi:hypothetical protein
MLSVGKHQCSNIAAVRILFVVLLVALIAGFTAFMSQALLSNG